MACTHVQRGNPHAVQQCVHAYFFCKPTACIACPLHCHTIALVLPSTRLSVPAHLVYLFPDTGNQALHRQCGLLPQVYLNSRCARVRFTIACDICDQASPQHHGLLDQAPSQHSTPCSAGATSHQVAIYTAGALNAAWKTRTPYSMVQGAHITKARHCCCRCISGPGS